MRDHHHQLVAQEVRLLRPQQIPLSEIAHGLLSGGDVHVGGGPLGYLPGQRLRGAVANGYDVSGLVLEQRLDLRQSLDQAVRREDQDFLILLVLGLGAAGHEESAADEPGRRQQEGSG